MCVNVCVMFENSFCLDFSFEMILIFLLLFSLFAGKYWPK